MPWLLGGPRLCGQRTSPLRSERQALNRARCDHPAAENGHRRGNPITTELRRPPAYRAGRARTVHRLKNASATAAGTKLGGLLGGLGRPKIRKRRWEGSFRTTETPGNLRRLRRSGRGGFSEAKLSERKDRSSHSRLAGNRPEPSHTVTSRRKLGRSRQSGNYRSRPIAARGWRTYRTGCGR